MRHLELLITNPQQKTLLIHYLALLEKWNKSYNLTAIDDPNEALTLHLLDSLSTAPFVTGQTILDLGSGGGLPGIPLAIYFPEKQFTLLDSNQKKTRFLTQVQLELNLKNVSIVTARAEKFSPPAPFDQIIARAVMSAADLIVCSQHLLKPQGQWLFMKARHIEEELQALERPAKVIPLKVPGLTAERNLLIVDN